MSAPSPPPAPLVVEDGSDSSYSYSESDDDLAKVEDEDWEIAERDFTKQYNRLRQHLAVSSGNAPLTSVACSPGCQPSKSSDTFKIASVRSIACPFEVLFADKSDRATNEQVLDPRTRIILFKMIGRGLIHEVNGCVSTGKEANVYHALTPEFAHLALKIYKTSILVFKDRDRYVTGEYRFRRGYNRRNPRKMVRLWAEKELRNLRRLQAAGIPCPEPFEVRQNVLVMSFLGNREGWASPRLKDAEINDSSVYASLYSELLVHADLSEYNILYHDDHLYIIDVSQSVEHDHPSAFDFLRSDIKNVEEFFAKMGISCLGLRRCFEFVVKEKLDTTEELDAEEVFKKWLELSESEDSREGESIEATSGRSAHEDAVFEKSYIPRTLGDLYDPEREVAALSLDDGQMPIYAQTIELVQPVKRVLTAADDTQVDDGEELPIPLTEDGSQDSVSDASSEHEGKDMKVFEDKRPRGHRHEDRDLKKERKRATKVEQRERRKLKVPKAEKKKRIKASL
ncbi:RIO1-domain-containing protein [Russula earlei]|uniref:RIO1-domain-containing protein n=1 Tax=Russula earlei TaxID=71964 RepID=A0ACC0U1A7_9AGAM|nr:RIO1-domain-containing protein [Russula earlei]